MTETDIDIIGSNAPILIRNIRINNKPQEIYIENGIIADIGGRIKDHDAEFIIDGDKAAALPGLANMHTHASMTLLRGYADDMQLFDWLSTKIWPTEAHLTEDDIYWGSKLACLEMIRTGTTLFNDMYFKMEHTADAVEESGIRACLSYCMIDGGDREKLESEIKQMKATVKNLKDRNNEKIIPGVSPHAVYTVSEEGLRWCAEFSKEQNIPLHIHVSETEQEVKDCIEAHKMTPPKWLDECGVLSNRCLAAHCCWMNSEDISLFAKRGVTAVHNPVSNMKLAGNRAMPYPEMKNAGVNVTIGTDGASSNNDLDMFGEMKTAAILQKFFWNDPTAMPAADALKAATENGYKALGIKGGVLEKGYAADLILVSRNPTNVPSFSSVSNSVYAGGSGLAVSTTMCAGTVLMLDGIIPDAEEIINKAEQTAFNLAARASEN